MPAKKKSTKKKSSRKKTKRAKKKTTKKRATRKRASVKKEDPQMKKLLEISVIAQETNLTLIKSINELSKRMSNFISMFEEASKHVGDLKAVTKDEVEEIAKRIQDVVQNNKDLAEGLLALDQYVRRNRMPLR